MHRRRDNIKNELSEIRFEDINWIKCDSYDDGYGSLLSITAGKILIHLINNHDLKVGPVQ